MTSHTTFGSKTLGVLLVALLAGAPAVVLGAAQSGGQQQQQPPPPPPAPKPAQVAGKWVLTLEMSMGQATPALALKQEGEALTGTYTGRYGTFELKGTVKERKITFAFEMNADGTATAMSFVGEVAADAQSMKGTAVLGELGEANWSAKREKQ
jgi:hypothetical protein